MEALSDQFSRFQTVKVLQLKQSRLEAQQHKLKQENAELKAEKHAALKQKDKLKASKKAKCQDTMATSSIATPHHGAPNDLAPHDSGDKDEDEEDSPDALQVRKKFFICGKPWIIPLTANLFRTPKPHFTYNDPSCYGSDKMSPEELLSGAVADLYHIVLRKLHEKMSSPAGFQQEVCLIPSPACCSEPC